MLGYCVTKYLRVGCLILSRDCAVSEMASDSFGLLGMAEVRAHLSPRPCAGFVFGTLIYAHERMRQPQRGMLQYACKHNTRLEATLRFNSNLSFAVPRSGL